MIRMSIRVTSVLAGSAPARREPAEDAAQADHLRGAAV
jgi:hypothetical protein